MPSQACSGGLSSLEDFLLCPTRFCPCFAEVVMSPDGPGDLGETPKTCPLLCSPPSLPQTGFWAHSFCMSPVALAVVIDRIKRLLLDCQIPKLWFEFSRGKHLTSPLAFSGSCREMFDSNTTGVKAKIPAPTLQIAVASLCPQRAWNLF